MSVKAKWLTALALIQIVLTLWGLWALTANHLIRFIGLALLQGAAYAAAVFLLGKMGNGIGRGGAEVPMWLIVAVAVALRCCLLFSAPLLSSDVYRYVWDGRVQAAGINPYRYVPDEYPLEQLRDARIYPYINRRDYAHTIYPPVAEMFFLAATRVSQSVVWMKTAMAVCDLLTMGALVWLLKALKLPQAKVLIYAWHPLVVWEFAGNGHVDALAMLLIVLALCAFHARRNAWAGVSLAGAVAVKMFPLMLLPALFRRWRWTLPLSMIGTLALAYLPYLGVGRGVLGFLPNYAEEEGLSNGERFYPLTVVRHLLGLVGTDWGATFYTWAVLAVLAGIALFTLTREDDTPTRIRWAAAMVCAFTVLFSPHYAWYFAWVVPFLVFETFWPMIYLTLGCFGLYGVKWIATEMAEFRINSAVYAPFYLLLLYSAGMWAKRRRVAGS